MLSAVTLQVDVPLGTIQGMAFHTPPFSPTHTCTHVVTCRTQDTALARFGHQLAPIPVFLTAPAVFLSTREVLRCLLI